MGVKFISYGCTKNSHEENPKNAINNKPRDRENEHCSFEHDYHAPYRTIQYPPQQY